ncbi:hypothetical protein ABVT39_024032 [Epinephelus coioides]
MGLDWATKTGHDQTVLILEPTGEKKAGKTKEHLEKVCRGRTQGIKNILEGSREDRQTLNQLEKVCE